MPLEYRSYCLLKLTNLCATESRQVTCISYCTYDWLIQNFYATYAQFPMQEKAVLNTTSLDTKFNAIQKWIVWNVQWFTIQLRVTNVRLFNIDWWAYFCYESEFMQIDCCQFISIMNLSFFNRLLLILQVILNLFFVRSRMLSKGQTSRSINWA